MSAFDPRFLRHAITALTVRIRQFGAVTATNVQDALEQIVGFIAGKHDKTGFDVDATGAYTCTLTYNETTRTVTLTPLSGTFDIYIQGTKYSKTTQSLAHPATDANHFFYFDETGTFVTSTTPWDVLIHAPACFVFQDATNNRRIPFEERHHADADAYWHRNQHFAEGTKTIAGFASTDITGYTLATGTDAACTFAIASGTIADEDIQVVSEVLPDNGPYNILERNGAAGAWQLTRANTVPFKRSGTVLQYNQNNAGTWQLTTVANGDHVNYYVFAVTALPKTDITPNPSATQQIVIVPSQQKFTNLVTAHSETVGSLSWGTIPFQEIVPIYKLIFKYSSAAGGTISLEQVDKIVGSAVSLSSSAPTDHGSLTGLSDLDHPASAIINTPAGNIAATNVQAALNELDSEKLAIASLGTGVQTFLATPSSANLAAAITNETGSGALVFGTSPTITGPTISSGNLNFSGTGQRIAGDFSNGTLTNRVLFQSSVANGTTSLSAIPNGASTSTNFAVFNSSDPDNAAVAVYDISNTFFSISVLKTGTGSYLPLRMGVGGSFRLFTGTDGHITPGADNTQNFGSGSLRWKEIFADIFTATTSLLSSGILGFGAGAGGSVTQLTSKSTAVTLNKACGRVVTHNESMATGTSRIFVLNNSTIGEFDTIVVCTAWNTNPSAYTAQVTHVHTGTASIRLTNISGSTLSDVLSIKFSVIRGVIS